jgi:hypothetical protein
MKNLILTCILIAFNSGFLIAQENKLQLNRAYGQIGVSIHNHIQCGLYIHIFDNITIAGNLLSTSIKVAEYKGGLFSSSSSLEDEFKSKNILFGLSTSKKKKFDFDVLLGFSELKGKINHNVYLYQDPFSSSHNYYKSTVEYFSEYGVSSRFDLNFEFHKFFGLNLSLQNVYTKRHNEFSVALGVTFGLVQDRIRK